MCGLHSQIRDSIRPLRECTKIAVNKRRTLLFYTSAMVRVSVDEDARGTGACARAHTVSYRDVVGCSKREKWLAEGKG